MNDWDISYAEAGRAFLNGMNPYIAVPTYVNPPWTLLVFAPLSWVPWQIMFFVPAIIVVVLSFRARKPLIPLIFGTSFPFIALSVYGNYDWVVLLGLMIGGPVGVVLQTMKPQAGGLGFVSELRGKSIRELIVFFLPVTVLAILGTILFPMWIGQMFGVTPLNAERNISLFPYSIPFALYFLWRCFWDREPIWGVLASVGLAPYLYIHSLTPLIFLLAKKDWRLGVLANLATWGIVLLVLVGVLKIKF
jgi:hypothetical protein